MLPTALKVLEESCSSTSCAHSAVSLRRAARLGHPWLTRMAPAAHPGRVVEPVLLASVRPPTLTYVPAIPRRVGKTGVLSEHQLEAVLHAGQCHAQPLRQTGTRPGFLLADGAGVGKGRTQAAIILDAWLQGHQKALWVSASADLYADAKRDLMAVCTATSGLPPLHQMLTNLTSVPQHAPIPSSRGGGVISSCVPFACSSCAPLCCPVLLLCFSLLQLICPADPEPNSTSALSFAVVFASYALLARPSRLAQVLAWCTARGTFQGVLALDESHRAKAAGASGAGSAVIHLQRKLPLARTVYSSATSATEVDNLQYLCRLGLWGRGTPFKSFAVFREQMLKGGAASKELLPLHLKACGSLVSRLISYQDVRIRVATHQLTPEQAATYDAATRLWQALSLTLRRRAPSLPSSAASRFWSAHQRFFRCLVTGFKLPTLHAILTRGLAEGKRSACLP